MKAVEEYRAGKSELPIVTRLPAKDDANADISVEISVSAHERGGRKVEVDGVKRERNSPHARNSFPCTKSHQLAYESVPLRNLAVDGRRR
jgi:hypothetical protein